MKRTPELPKSRDERRRVANYLRQRIRRQGKPIERPADAQGQAQTKAQGQAQRPSRCTCGPVRHWECNAGCKYQFTQEN